MPPKRTTDVRPVKANARTRLLDGLDRTVGTLQATAQHIVGKRTGRGDSPGSCDTVVWDEAVSLLGGHFGGDARSILEEPALIETESRIRRLLEEIRHKDPFRRVWAADSLFARCCYLTLRLARPRVVVETGVAYGVSSAFMLRAMEMNGFGELHSLDLPPIRHGARRFRGIAIPDELRHRWTLYDGSSRRLLPPILESLGGIDLFLHDSLHTRQNMRREFQEVWPRLNPGGVLLADDVERNGAFGELLQNRPALLCVVADRETEPLHGAKSPVVFGVAVKGSGLRKNS